MIAESSRALLILLAVLTFLGAVMGYCVALIVAKRAARRAIDSIRRESGQEKLAAEPDLAAAGAGLATFRSVKQGAAGESGDRESGVKPDSALETKASLQAERIQSLESQLTILKQKQRRLISDFASYKSAKNRELELAKRSSGQWTDTANLPTLSRKVDSKPSSVPVNASESASGNGNAGAFDARHAVLGKPLSREIDIPALAESELPDSVDHLDFDMSVTPGSGARRRG